MPTIETSGIETYYERQGSGPPVVFVHGAGVDLEQWRPQLDALADEYTTVAYDVRGHGRTGGSSTAPYSIELFADDLAGLIEALDLDRPVVCGLSMGGCIAQVHAARHPEAVAGLVLADTFTPTILSRSDWLQRRLLRVAIPPIELLGYERVERGLVWLQERFQRGVAGDYDQIRRLRERGPPMTTAEFTKVLRAVADFETAEIDYSRIGVPTLVIYGEDEAGFVRQHAAKLGAEIATVDLVAVPDAGHVSNLDNPAFFTERLRELLGAAFAHDRTETGGA